MTDQDFPHIQYQENKSYLQWGLAHGEEYRKGIKELAEIRKNLMLARSPHLANHLDEMALEQFELTKNFSPELGEELSGIIKGSETTPTDIIILNNYTDFRDIHLPDQGCSTIGMNREEKSCGQTWDMHSSAKNYVCAIELPNQWTVFSLVGCLGMMGANKHSLFIGVNNINTKKARSGVIWPAFVRKALEQSTLDQILELKNNCSFTSGHNYLFSNGKSFQHWEIAPETEELISQIKEDEENLIFHTNHCLGKEVSQIEEKLSVNSTSLERYQLIKQKEKSVHTTSDIKSLLQDHEGYPKSICSHFQSGAQDPSTTCGGGVFNHQTKALSLWRGCPHEDKNYKEIDITIN